MKTTFRTAALAAVVACAQAALGANTKFTEFTATSPENPDVDGVAHVKYNANQNKTHIHAVIDGLLPNTTYGIFVFGSNSLYSDPLALTTNHKGKGNYNATTDHDQATGATFVIFIDANANGRPYDDNGFLENDEIRAISTP